MVKFRCQHCTRKLGVQEDYIGRQVRCPQCGEALVVPRPGTAGAVGYTANERTQYAVFVCRGPEEAQEGPALPEIELFFRR